MEIADLEVGFSWGGRGCMVLTGSCPGGTFC